MTQSYISLVWHTEPNTRKLSYRKDDRAMRLIHGCPALKIFESLSTPATPTATFAEVLNGLLFRSIL